MFFFWSFKSLPSLKLTIRPWKWGFPKGKGWEIPTIKGVTPRCVSTTNNDLFVRHVGLFGAEVFDQSSELEDRNGLIQQLQDDLQVHLAFVTDTPELN